MNQTIRLFIAVELDQGIKEELKNIQEDLKKLVLDVKWVELKNIHLTLKFLGNVGLDDLEKVKLILKETTVQFKPFEINLSDLGVFPKVVLPRVIWVGINQGKNEVVNLTSVLERELEKIGFASENRKFSPHLTLGRVKSIKNKDKLKNYLNSAKYNFQKRQDITEIILFSSQLSSQGPTYAPLASFPLLPP